MVIIVFQFSGIHPCINLGNGFLTERFHLFQILRIFYLKDRSLSIYGIINGNVASSLSVFLIGFHQVSGFGTEYSIGYPQKNGGNHK